ncbi:hypothetical protein BDR05DRAFT_789513 [Suillus weaverae]|nr:hypothetical protein BDR05DRAFT_789513 [Suillus weaverae]
MFPVISAADKCIFSLSLSAITDLYLCLSARNIDRVSSTYYHGRTLVGWKRYASTVLAPLLFSSTPLSFYVCVLHIAGRLQV